MEKKPKLDHIDIIIGSMKPKGLPTKMERKPDPMKSEDFVEEVEASDKDIMEESIAEGMLQAIKLGDAKALAQALKDWHEVCYGGADIEGPSEEDDDKLEY
jgi:hypothetical protein